MVISEQQLVNALEEAKVGYNKHSPGVYVVVYEADEEFNHRIIVQIIYSEDNISLRAYGEDYVVPEARRNEALEFCNNLRKSVYGSFFLDEDQNLSVFYRIPIMDSLDSPQYVAECLKLCFAAIIYFFKQVGEKLDN